MVFYDEDVALNLFQMWTLDISEKPEHLGRVRSSSSLKICEYASFNYIHGCLITTRLSLSDLFDYPHHHLVWKEKCEGLVAEKHFDAFMKHIQPQTQHLTSQPTKIKKLANGMPTRRIVLDDDDDEDVMEDTPTMDIYETLTML
eukprot:CAMPEP_0117422030 /NCGR_PEP_ID=MMETSP0758-20121206/2958_1 /TAXON_ID=63605 /ORGANISM="Percolomonas cosmopolitus, Strain AE-1 (ATCC 50343)" /LENGTH=143 /DNA_ID=CAMNT_0005204419 /DNA_START=1533 /DNA_END=1960 /DNA_ORIENTATION=+